MADSPASKAYVSRGGIKLAAALDDFQIDPTGLICADLGSHVGGFVDCLLQRGAAKVYSVDTSYGTLAWKLRKDDRVVVVERTNAIHVTLAEPVDLVTVDVGWTPQSKILPNVATLLKPNANPDPDSCSNSAPDHSTNTTAQVITLIKPHYEAQKSILVDGVVPEEKYESVVTRVVEEIESLGWYVLKMVPSPLRGHGGNQEVFALIKRRR